MADVNIQEIVDEVLATIAQQSINSQLGFSVDADGYLCVDTEVVDTSSSSSSSSSASS